MLVSNTEYLTTSMGVFLFFLFFFFGGARTPGKAKDN